MTGWRYEWVGELPRDVRGVIVDEMNRLQQPKGED